MFKWLFKGILSEIKGEIAKDFIKEQLIETLNDEEVQKYIVEFTDTLYQRYMQKAVGTISKMSASGIVGEGTQMPNIMNSKGQINLKGLLPMFLNSAFGNKTHKQGGLP